VFYPPQDTNGRRVKQQVINPRGLRAYVCNNAFFQAIPMVLAQQPDVAFVCPAMAGEPQPERWVAELNIASAVQLLPRLSQPQLAEVFRQSAVAVSPTIHDGTPNTLLEAMACGCYPIAGDLESLREWIKPGVNGTLINPESPQALAQAILTALKQPELRAQATGHNLKLIKQRADSRKVMAQAESFYQKIVGKELNKLGSPQI
jgi:glycosyltransferase involved in cell wall biosynthesis